MKTSFTYNASKLWNKLPQEVKQAENIVSFKNKLGEIKF